MKSKYILLLLVLVSLAACGSSQSGLPEAIPECSDQDAFCVEAAHVFINEERNTVQVVFDMTDMAGGVREGTEPFFKQDAFVVLLDIDRPEQIGKVRVNGVTDSGDAFLYGRLFFTGEYSCYVGEDIAWKPGWRAAVCGFALPLDALNKPIAAGDLIGVQVVHPGIDFAVPVIVEEN